MAKYATAGKSKVYWLTTVTIAAPTAAQLNAGVNLGSFVRNMPGVPRTTNLIDVATIDSKFEKRQVGTRGGDVGTIEVLRDDATDTGYTTLPEDTAGFMCIGRKGGASLTVWTAGDKVDIFPATVASVEDATPGRNDPDTANISFAVTDSPSRNVTVV